MLKFTNVFRKFCLLGIDEAHMRGGDKYGSVNSSPPDVFAHANGAMRTAIVDGVTILVCALILPLLGVLIIGSLLLGRCRSMTFGSTLANYISVLSDPFAHRLFLNTLVYAGASLAVSLSITIAFVWLVERTNIPFKNFIHLAMFVPLIMPGALTAFGWVLLLSPRQGFINVALRDLLGLEGAAGPLDIYTFAGMVFLTGTGIVPSMFIMLSAAFLHGFAARGSRVERRERHLPRSRDK